MVDYINKGKNLKTKNIDSGNKNKCVAYCNYLLKYYLIVDIQILKKWKLFLVT